MGIIHKKDIKEFEKGSDPTIFGERVNASNILFRMTYQDEETGKRWCDMSNGF